eukprot:gene9358-11074_t
MCRGAAAAAALLPISRGMRSAAARREHAEPAGRAAGCATGHLFRRRPRRVAAAADRKWIGRPHSAVATAGMCCRACAREARCAAYTFANVSEAALDAGACTRERWGFALRVVVDTADTPHAHLLREAIPRGALSSNQVINTWRALSLVPPDGALFMVRIDIELKPLFVDAMWHAALPGTRVLFSFREWMREGWHGFRTPGGNFHISDMIMFVPAELRRAFAAAIVHYRINSKWNTFHDLWDSLTSQGVEKGQVGFFWPLSHNGNSARDWNPLYHRPLHPTCAAHCCLLEGERLVSHQSWRAALGGTLGLPRPQRRLCIAFPGADAAGADLPGAGHIEQYACRAECACAAAAVRPEAGGGVRCVLNTRRTQRVRRVGRKRAPATVVPGAVGGAVAFRCAGATAEGARCERPPAPAGWFAPPTPGRGLKGAVADRRIQRLHLRSRPGSRLGIDFTDLKVVE